MMQLGFRVLISILAISTWIPVEAVAPPGGPELYDACSEHGNIWLTHHQLPGLIDERNGQGAIYFPGHDGVVVLQTRVERGRGHIWRSEDYGKTFIDIIRTFGASESVDMNPSRWYVSEADSANVFIVRSNGEMWVSQDVGKTWAKAPFAGKHVVLVQPHPTSQVLSIVTTESSGCRTPTALTCFRTAYLYGLVTQKVVEMETYVTHVEWAKLGHVFLSHYPDKTGDYRKKDQLTQKLEMSTDNFVTAQSRVLIDVVLTSWSYYQDTGTLWIISADFQDDLQIVVSVDNGATLKVVTFPSTDNKPSQYIDILGEEEGVSLVQVLDRKLTDKGDLYVSDAADGAFSLSLPGQCHDNTDDDLKRVHGLDGSWISARWINLPPFGEFQQTLFTHSNGDFWEPLGKPTNPSPGCILNRKCNLVLPLSKGSPFSSKNAPGILVAAGVENYQASSPSASTDFRKPPDTYLSSNGGSSWTQVLPGRHTAQFGDKGALILFGEEGARVSKIRFTWNFGASIEECTMMKGTDFKLEGILSEPSHDEPQFLVHGAMSATETRVTYVDFRQLHNRECAAADYVEWAPSESCIYGKKTVFKAKIPTALCFNPPSFNPVARETPCKCDGLDFTCNDCMLVDPDSGTCIADPSCPFSNTQFGAPVPCTGMFKTQVFKKRKGNVCEEASGVTWLAPSPFPCPVAPTPSPAPTAQATPLVVLRNGGAGAGVALAIMSLVIVVLLLAGSVLGLRFLRRYRLTSVATPHISMLEDLPMLNTDDLSSPLVSPREQFAISSMENSPREEISLDLSKLKDSMDNLPNENQ